MLTAPRRLTVAVVCSRHAPGLLELACCGDRGRAWDVTCCVTSEPDFAERHDLEARGVAVLSHSIAEFCAVRGASVYHDHASRMAYDAATVALLEPFAPDLVLLDGYLYLVTEPFLSAFGGRILNLHYADLTLRRANGGPRFPGIRAVRDALAAGAAETRATVHLVNAEPDGGAPIVRSWPFPVSPLIADARTWSATAMFKAYVFAHQEWMMRAVSGPLLRSALRLIARQHVSLRDIALQDPAAVQPWDLERDGRLGPPIQAAAMPIGARL